MKFLGLLLLCASAFAQNAFHLKSGDTVVFYGDSITDQRLYTTFVETYAVTRFPKMNLTFVHSGWGGDRVSGGGGGPVDVRLKRDVFAYKPTVVTIMLGMNDGSYRAFDQAVFDKFASGYVSMVKSIKAAFPNARLTLIQPSPYDDVTRPALFPGGYNAVLVKYGEFLKELAQKENTGLADLNTSVVAELTRANTADSTGAQRLIQDRVHPGPAVHLLMAKALLKAWNAPAVVSTVEIDGAASKVTTSDNTAVTDLNGLSWTQLDNALPMPVDKRVPGMTLALDSSDTIESLNRQMLRVTALPAAKYNLTIDDQQVGFFTKEQLAEGINLATLATPMMKQASDVHALTLKHTNIHNARWRNVQTVLADDALPSTQSAMDALDKVEVELVAKQREMAQPKPHRYQLVAAE
jgi:lysophospholipase L1-like esterase